jgi:hypothetical protein
VGNDVTYLRSNIHNISIQEIAGSWDSVVSIQARLRDGRPKKRVYIFRRGTRGFLLSSVSRPALEPI